MRYEFRGNTLRPKPVHYVRTGGKIISNPPDSLVDKLGVGYPLEVEPEPKYDPETEQIFSEYSFSDGVIYETWRVEQIEPEEAGGDEESVWDELDKAYEEGVNEV